MKHLTTSGRHFLVNSRPTLFCCHCWCDWDRKAAGGRRAGKEQVPLHIFSSEIPAWFGGDGRRTSVWLSAVSEATLRKKKTLWRVRIGCLWKLLRERPRTRCCFLGDFPHGTEAPSVLAAALAGAFHSQHVCVRRWRQCLMLLPCCGSGFPSQEECPSLRTQGFLSSHWEWALCHFILWRIISRNH